MFHGLSVEIWAESEPAPTWMPLLMIMTPAEWRRFVGRWASVLAPDFGGRLEGEIVEFQDGEGEAAVLLRPERGEAKRIPLAGIKEARLAFRFS